MSSMDFWVGSRGRHPSIQYQIHQNVKDIWDSIRGANPGMSDQEITGYFLKAFSNVIFESSQAQPPDNSCITKEKKPIRVYVDGCFDIMHSGHYNALRQAKSLGDILVAGVHSDEEIARQKGMPVMNNEERLSAVRACKWVDEVVFDTPYQPTIELLDRLNCDFVVHGDDIPVCANGCDAYEEVRKAGRLRIIRRTDGVSTTDLVGRLLIMTRDHHMHSVLSSPSLSANGRVFSSRIEPSNSFHATAKRISQFSNNRSASPDDRIVYIAGSFDLFHVGHIETLEQAKKLGTYLYVGLHDDQTVNKIYGSNLPIMNLHERVLNVLSCKAVDEVILCVPWAINEHFIKSLHIEVVASGGNVDEVPSDIDGTDRFAISKAMGIHQHLKPVKRLTTNDVIQRIVDNRLHFENKHRTRSLKEAKYQDENQYNVTEV